MKRSVAFIFAILFLQCSFNTKAQIITTIAGNGTPGYSGDGAAATAAQLNNEWEVATDALGNIYVSDYYNNRIRKIDAAGNISTIAGTGIASTGGDGGPAILAQVNEPTGIATDISGNIYFSDYFRRVRKIDPSGVITTIAGTGIGAYSGDGGPATAADIYGVFDIAADGAGNVYITNAAAINRIRKVDAAGIITSIAGNGTAGYSGDGGPATDASINIPTGLATDNYGNLYIADRNNHRIRKVNPSGIITTIAGTGTAGFSGDGGPATAANIHSPQFLTIDDEGNLYFSSLTMDRIRRISASGIISTFAGTGVSGYSGDGRQAPLSQLSLAKGLAMFGSGKVYVADNGNSVVRVITDDTVAFANGDVPAINACGPTPINAALAVNDADTGQALHWSLVSPPAHGTAMVAYSDTATGATVIPTGLTYIPAVGYVGTDTFRVRVYDEMLADTTMVCVTVYPANPGTITGPDTVCVGHTTTLTDAVPGGAWSAGNTNVTVSSAGVVTGVAVGTVPVSYTITNPCITASAVHPVYVKPAGALCNTAVADVAVQSGITLYPNPNKGTFTFSVAEDAQAVLTNAAGKMIKEITVPANTPVTIEADIPAGIYFLSARTASGLLMEKITVVK